MGTPGQQGPPGEDGTGVIEGLYLGSVEAYPETPESLEGVNSGLYLGGVNAYSIKPIEQYLGAVETEIPLGSVSTGEYGTIYLGKVADIYRPTEPGWHMNIPKPTADAGDYNLTTIVKGTLKILPSFTGFDSADIFETEREIDSPVGIGLYGKREEHLVTLTALDYGYSPLRAYEPNTDKLDAMLRVILSKAVTDPNHFIINIESEYPEYYTPLLQLRPGSAIVLRLRQDYDWVYNLIANKVGSRLSVDGLYTVRIDASNRL